MRKDYNTKTNKAWARFVDAYYREQQYNLGVL